MLEMLLLANFEQRCAALSEHVSSRRAEITGKLHKMGYGGSLVPFSLYSLECAVSCLNVGCLQQLRTHVSTILSIFIQALMKHPRMTRAYLKTYACGY